MRDTTSATLRIPGAPCWAIGYGQLAVWKHDEITILTRIGKRYLCRVIYGAEGHKITFYSWLPKKWLRRKDSFRGRAFEKLRAAKESMSMGRAMRAVIGPALRVLLRVGTH